MMASVEVLSAKIAHADDATLELMNKTEETTIEEVETDSETKERDDVAPKPETLAIAMETKVVIAIEPITEKKLVETSNKVAPEPVEEKIEDTAEVAPELVKEKIEDTAEVEPEAEGVVAEKKDEEVKEVEEKVSPQAKVEKKEE